MVRTLYTLCVIALLGSTAWTATGFSAAPQPHGARLGLVLLTALQR